MPRLEAVWDRLEAILGRLGAILAAFDGMLDRILALLARRALWDIVFGGLSGPD